MRITSTCSRALVVLARLGARVFIAFTCLSLGIGPVGTTPIDWRGVLADRSDAPLNLRFSLICFNCATAPSLLGLPTHMTHTPPRKATVDGTALQVQRRILPDAQLMFVHKLVPAATAMGIPHGICVPAPHGI